MKKFITYFVYLILPALLMPGSLAQNKPGPHSIELKIPDEHKAIIQNDEYKELPPIDIKKKEMYENATIRSNGESYFEQKFYNDEESTQKVGGTVHTIISTLGDGFRNYCTVTEQTGTNAGRIWVIATVIEVPSPGNDKIKVFKYDQGVWSFYASLTLPYLFGDIDAELIEGGPDGPILWVITEYQDQVGFDTKLSLWALNLNQQTGVSMPFVWPGAGPQDIFYSPRLTSDNAVDQTFPVVFIVASLDSAIAGNNHLHAQKFAYISLANSISNFAIGFRNSILPIFWPLGGTTSGYHLYSDIAYINPPVGTPKLVFTYSNVPDRTRIWLSTCEINGTNAQAMGTIDGTGAFNIDASAIASPGGTDQTQLMVVAREDYQNSGDFDILSYRSDDGGLNWEFSYVEAYSSVSNFIPQIGTLLGRRNTLNEYYLSFALGDGTSAPDSIVSINSNIGGSHFWDAPVKMNIGFPNSYYSAVGITNAPGERLTVWSATGVNVFELYGSFWPNLPSSIFEDENSYVQSFRLEQNYPNPFNPSTKIQYSIPELSFVTLKVYDVLGNEIATLLNEEKLAGNYEVEFDSHSGTVRNLPSGIYFYKLQAGNPSPGSGQGFVDTKKMILLK